MITKVEPAPLAFPNGGGLKMSQQAPKSQGLEVEALKKKHEVELQKLKEKHAATNKPKSMAPKKAMRRNQGR